MRRTVTEFAEVENGGGGWIASDQEMNNNSIDLDSALDLKWELVKSF